MYPYAFKSSFPGHLTNLFPEQVKTSLYIQGWGFFGTSITKGFKFFMVSIARTATTFHLTQEIFPVHKRQSRDGIFTHLLAKYLYQEAVIKDF